MTKQIKKYKCLSKRIKQAIPQIMSCTLDLFDYVGAIQWFVGLISTFETFKQPCACRHIICQFFKINTLILLGFAYRVIVIEESEEVIAQRKEAERRPTDIEINGTLILAQAR